MTSSLSSPRVAESSDAPRRKKLDPFRIAAWVSLAVMIPLACRMSLDPGITTDELMQRVYGDYVLAWYRSGFQDRNALSYINLFLYGGLFDLPAQFVISTGLSPWGRYETRHVLTALVAVGGIVATWLTANRIAGPRAALAAAAMLTLTPAWVGHGLFNPKDIPFGTAAAFVMYASVRITMRRPPLAWSDALWAGAALGCTLGVRSGGMFMLAYPVLAACLRFGADLVSPERRALPVPQLARDAGVMFGRLICVFPLIWTLMLSAWPWAQEQPFVRPFTAASIAAHFGWHGRMRFDGRMISNGDIPASYLPRWFQVTLPDIYLLALACAVLALLGAALRRRFDPARGSSIVLLALLVVMPFIGVLVLHPVIYTGHRHFLFVLPPMAVLAGLALEHVVSERWFSRFVRGVVAALALLLAVVTANDMLSLHPYEYLYFNRASGGLARQALRFETDYWGATYREGIAWVVQNYEPTSTRKISIKICASDNILGYYLKTWNATRFRVAKDRESAEVFLASITRDCYKQPGEVIHKVERQGVPLLYVLKRPR